MELQIQIFIDTLVAKKRNNLIKTRKFRNNYARWFMAGGAIRIAHYDVIDDVITRKL